MSDTTESRPFRYYRDDTPLAFLRRVLIAFLPASLIVYELNLLFSLFQGDGSWFTDAYAAVRGIKVFEAVLPVSFNSPGGLIAVTLPLGLFFYRKLSRRIDAWLFAPFNLLVMEPIRRATGIFTWVPSSEARQVYDGLLSWTREDSRIGAQPLRWLWSEPDHGENGDEAPFEPFAFTALLGPNGCGKSQLVRELARELSQRGTLGDPPDGCSFPDKARRLLAALRYWWHRVNPGRAKADDPWDAGMLRCDQASLRALSNWRPRAPTLLVLDDPGSSVCGKVIEALVAIRNHFAFPVRLIVVDQFIPADLPVSPPPPHWSYQGERLTLRSPFTMFRLPEARFDQAQFRVASAEFWRPVPSLEHPGRMLFERVRSSEMRALYKREDIQNLIDAYDGAPLLLALAVLWLDRNPSKRVADLLETEPTEEERRLFKHYRGAQSTDGTRVHRLMCYRVKELYDSHHQFRRGLPQAVAVATVAGGLSTSTADAKFDLQISRDLPRFGDWHDSYRIAPVSPRALGTYYAQLVRGTDFRDNPGAFMEAIVAAALEVAPGQTLKWLVRATWLGEDRIDWVDSRRADDPDWAFVRWQAYASAALDRMPEMLPRAAQVLAGIADAQLDSLLLALERLEHSATGSDPSWLGEMRFDIGTRRLLASDQAVEREMDWLARWVKFSPDIDDDSPDWIIRWGDALAQVVARSDDADHLLQALYPELCDFHSRHVRSSLARALAKEAGEGISHDGLRCWAALLKVQDEAVPITDAAATLRYPNLPAPPAWSGDEIELWSAMVLNADIRRQLLASRARNEIDVLSTEPYSIAALKDEVLWIEHIVQPFAQDPLKQHRLHLEWAEARRHLAFGLAHAAESDACRQAVKAVEDIVQPFARDPLKWHKLHLEWAQAWQSLAFALALEDGQSNACRDAVDTIEHIAQPFARDPLKWHRMQLVRAQAWGLLAHRLSEEPGQSDACCQAVEAVERIVQPFAKDSLTWLSLRWVWAAAWRDRAHALSQLPGQSNACREAANMVERIVQPFAHDPLKWNSLQLLRAEAWRVVAYARAQEAGQSAACREAVNMVERIVWPFAQDPLKWHALHSEWVRVWYLLTYALSKEPGQSAACREAVKRVERIVQPFARDPLKWHNMHRGWAFALRNLAYALCTEPGQSNACRQAVKAVEDIVQPFARDPLKWYDLHLEWAQAWEHLIFALSQDADQYHVCRQAVEAVERIIQPFENCPEQWPRLRLIRENARNYLRQALSRQGGNLNDGRARWSMPLRPN